MGEETLDAWSTRFNDLLVDSGLITPDELAIANLGRSRTGEHIDDILITLGLVDGDELVRVLSKAWSMPAVRIANERIDSDLLDETLRHRYLDEGWLPLHLDSDRVVVATSNELTPTRVSRISEVVGPNPRFVVTSSWDIKEAVLRVFHSVIADEAANELWRQNPRLSARQVLSRSQRVVLTGGLVVLAGIAVWQPIVTAVTSLTIASLAFLGATVFKFVVALRGARFDIVERITPEQVAALADADLPRYTVLVPVFREANIVGKLVENLGALDYPADKLEILILTEEEDQATRDAIALSDPPENFQVVTVPAGVPQTKPRACNVGLYLATGDYLVIYDAEDRPDPDQLKKAVIAFRRGGRKTVCVQAALNYFNANENILTRMFTLEYSYWFDYMLPGLDRSSLPIPLGGTSNHFRVDSLMRLGGWDPYNVTEDADLGIRAAAMGFRVGVVNSTTMEEANTSIPNFIRQRSRWIKGYMQTSLVHARDPLSLIRKVGLRSFLGFVLLIAGTPAVFLAVVPFMLLTAVTLVFGAESIQAIFPPWLLWICLTNFLVGNAITVYLTMMGPFKRGTFSLIGWSLLNPLYWMLHSIAAYKGLWQLIIRPHYWEKTEHGLTTHTASEVEAAAAESQGGEVSPPASPGSIVPSTPEQTRA